MILVPIIAVLAGFALSAILKLGPVTGTAGIYLGVACLAGLDTMFGGIRSGMEGKFQNDVFISGFIVNVLIAFSVAWMGDNIGQNLVLVAALVFGMRIFSNLGVIRRFVVTKWHDELVRRREQAEKAAQTQNSQANS
ncbi:MAG TPA: small basic family protein [Fimbriimonadaceae bacterium]|nr:small basic family protein [Fimbriimonadaceae bacterium]